MLDRGEHMNHRIGGDGGGLAFAFQIHRDIAGEDGWIGQKRSLQGDLRVGEVPLEQLKLMALHLAIRHKLARARQAHRGQRKLLLMTGDALLVTRVTQKRGGGILSGLGERRERALNGLGSRVGFALRLPAWLGHL